MWALRRAPSYLKSGRINIGSSNVALAKLDISCYNLEEKVCIFESHEVKHGRSLSLLSFYHTKHAFSYISNGRRSLSSQAGAKSDGVSNDLEDGLSDPEGKTRVYISEEETVSDSELSGGEADTKEAPQLEVADTESNHSVEKTSEASYELLNVIISAPGISVTNTLDKFAKEGNNFSQGEITLAMHGLRNRRMYGRALQFSEWLESNKKIDFSEKDYASRLDLIAKVRGLQKAESYIDKIPKSFKGEIVYRTMLATCVACNNVKKAEEVFEEMRGLQLPLTSFACNQLIILYRRHNKNKIPDVLLLMEKENVNPCHFTYKLLIDIKGSSSDITGMDQVVEKMKEEGIEPDINVLACLAKHYAAGGLKEKAELVLKEIEEDYLLQNRWACRLLLPIYAKLGKIDDVRRIWKLCESDPRIDHCTAAIEAFGKLKKIEEAEAVFEKMISTWKNLSSKHYAALLNVYADEKMLSKGNDVIQRMSDNLGNIGPEALDVIVKFYVGAGEVEKADAILEKATKKYLKPEYASYMIILSEYAKSGDVHNAERMFLRVKQGGHRRQINQFNVLTRAYANANLPAYGMRDRLRADNIIPTVSLAELLVKTDAFRKTAASELLN